MKGLIIVSMLLLASCGQKTVNKYYQDPVLQAELDKLKDDMKYLSRLVIEQGASVISLEQLMTDTQGRLSELETGDRVVGVVDPCGDNVNQFDEVLFKMSSGKFIAYFEQGNNRFMTVLSENTNYRTTDVEACNFKIVNGNLQLI